MAATVSEFRRRALAPLTDKAGTFSPLKAVTFLLIVVIPTIWIVYAYTTSGNPTKALVRETGLWGIRFIILTLAITPMRRILAWPKLINVRRMIGVAAFVYSAVHLWAYVVDMAYEWGDVGSEIVQQLYLGVGTLAVLAMVPLAVTSTDAMVKRLGGARWRRLHQIVYAVGVLAMLHFYLLLTKLHTDEAQILAGMLIWLLLYRLLYAWRGTMPTAWLVGLSVASAVLTMVAEAAYFFVSAAGRIPIGRVLAANFTLEGGLRPAWVVLLIGLVLAIIGIFRARPERPRRSRLDVPTAPA